MYEKKWVKSFGIAVNDIQLRGYYGYSYRYGYGYEYSYSYKSAYYDEEKEESTLVSKVRDQIFTRK